MARSPSTLALAAARVVLLAGPALLALFEGGYFTGPRLTALVVAWVALAVVVVAARPPAPRGPAAAALGGLVLLAAWTAASAAWAPLGGGAADAVERAVLYAGAVAAAYGAFRARRAARWAEPALALGTVVVVGAGLLGRLLPGVVDLDPSRAAAGRLDMPLTYWNGMGALAAIGIVLAARLAGDRTRPVALRAAAAAAAAPLGLGAYLAFSRGALVALAVGIAVLVALTPTWTQLRAVAVVLEAAALTAIAAALLPAVNDAEVAEHPGEGVAMVLLVLAAMALAAALQAGVARAERAVSLRAGPLPAAPRVRAAAWLAAAAVALAPFAAALAQGADSATPAFGETTARLTSAGSNRYGYWRVAVEAFADDPAVGGGAGSYPVAWLRERTDSVETVRDAHSLPLETAAELGLVGLAFLLLALGGVSAATVRLVRRDPALAAGPAAALTVWLSHASLDWDWELPALSLVAMVLAGMVLSRTTAD